MENSQEPLFNIQSADPFHTSLTCSERLRENKVQTLPLRSAFQSVDQQELHVKRLDERNIGALFGGFQL